MKKCRQCFDCPWKEKLLNTFGKECTDPCSPVWTVARLSDLQISSSPLLQQGCEEGTCKADHQAQEPKRIYPHCIVWWRERGWGSREGTRNVGSNRFSKSLVYVSEVEIRGVLWILLDILDGN